MKRDGKDPEPAPTALDRLRHQKTKIKDVEGVHMYNQSAPIELTAMEKFALYAEKRTKEAFARIDEVQENFKGVLCYFGEDPAMTSTDFFGTLNKFIATFDSALETVKRIEALKLAEEKKAAAMRAKEKTKKAAKAAMASKHLSKIAKKGPNQGSKGKLDLSGQRKKFADRKCHQRHVSPIMFRSFLNIPCLTSISTTVSFRGTSRRNCCNRAQG